MHALISAHHRCFCRTFHTQIIPFYISNFQTLFSWASLTKRLTILYAYNYKPKYFHKVLVNRLVKLAQKSLVRLTDCLNMTIAVDWDIKPQTKLDLCQETNITIAVFSEEIYVPQMAN